MKLGRLAIGGLVLGALTVGAMWIVPSNSYLLLPDAAKPLADKVKVEGEKPHAPGGIYYVDVVVREASLLEKLASATRPDGADIVPEQALVPPGSNFGERRRQNLQAMSRSQQVAAAVALRELGYKVTAKPEGARVVGVASDAPAHGKIQPTDVVIGVDGKPVQTPDDLRRLIGTHKPGETVKLRVRRDGATKVIEVGTIASQDGRPIVGVQVEQSADIKLPIDVDIDLGGVGGPSAGLAFALDIVDELGDDIDRGRTIVATGELALDGSVHPIGGVKQKAIGAKNAGADIFLVPDGNYEDAKNAVEGLRVIPVSTVDEALSALATN